MTPVLKNPPEKTVTPSDGFSRVAGYCLEEHRIRVRSMPGRWFHVEEFTCNSMAYRSVMKWQRHGFTATTRKENAADGFFMINVYAKWVAADARKIIAKHRARRPAERRWPLGY